MASDSKPGLLKSIARAYESSIARPGSIETFWLVISLASYTRTKQCSIAHLLPGRAHENLLKSRLTSRRRVGERTWCEPTKSDHGFVSGVPPTKEPYPAMGARSYGRSDAGDLPQNHLAEKLALAYSGTDHHFLLCRESQVSPAT